VDLFGLVREQLATEPAESKKYRMVAHGMWTVVGLFCAGAATCYIKPEIAGHIGPLANVAITAVSGLVAVYAGAQAAVEYKANSVLQQTQTIAEPIPPTGAPTGPGPCPQPTGPTGPPVVTPASTGAPAQPPFTPAAIVP